MNQTTFKELIWDYYREHGRDLPWRRTRDPYVIFVSEMMLQQTQVSRVLDKYPQFLSQFPDFATLVAAPVSAVVVAWQGMGYNRRALWLKRSAEVVVSEHNGKLPGDVNKLIKLPGIGLNTAGSIAAFAFNAPSVFVETNIRRVFIHHFFAGQTDVGDAAIKPLIEETLEPDNPREWYYALMDYGSGLSKAVTNPNRRSRHYAVQTKFEGSNRQKRAQILRLLADQTMQLGTISAQLMLPIDVIEPIVNTLISEGFIQAKGGIYSLVS